MSSLTIKISKAARERDGFVHFKYRIDRLKASNSKKAKNAEVRKPEFNQWGFHVIIIGNDKGDLKDKVFMPFIVKLPYEIEPVECDYDVTDGFITILLKKTNLDQEWASEILDDQLETAEQSEIDQFLEAKREVLESEGVLKKEMAPEEEIKNQGASEAEHI